MAEPLFANQLQPGRTKVHSSTNPPRTPVETNQSVTSTGSNPVSITNPLKERINMNGECNPTRYSHTNTSQFESWFALLRIHSRTPRASGAIICTLKYCSYNDGIIRAHYGNNDDETVSLMLVFSRLQLSFKILRHNSYHKGKRIGENIFFFFT